MTMARVKGKVVPSGDSLLVPALDVRPGNQRSQQPHSPEPVGKEELGRAELVGLLLTPAEPGHEEQPQPLPADPPHGSCSSRHG